jgi:AcrR family transcriptional regulator
VARLNPEAKREVHSRLLETAAAHFAEAGFERASVDAVSLAAGYAKGTLYNYFRSKEELFGAVIDEAARRAVLRYEAAEPGRSTRERLLALARADLTVLREDEPFTKVLVREAMSFRPHTYPLIAQHMAPFVAAVEAILARGVRDGELHPTRPVGELAALWVGMLSLCYVQHWGSGGAWPKLDEIPELVVDTFLHGAVGPR